MLRLLSVALVVLGMHEAIGATAVPPAQDNLVGQSGPSVFVGENDPLRCTVLATRVLPDSPDVSAPILSAPSSASQPPVSRSARPARPFRRPSRVLPRSRLHGAAKEIRGATAAPR
jgi:hypothetical protein